MFRSLLLQADPGQGGGMMQILFFVGIALVFYFFMIRPQQKRQKEQKKFVEELKRGDNVVTIGGIHGRILSVTDTTVVVEVDKGCKLTIQKTAISQDSSKQFANKNLE